MIKVLKISSITLVCLILGIMLAWQYRSVKENKLLATYESKRISDLQDELIREKKNNEQMRQRIQELQKDVNVFKDTEKGTVAQIKALRKDLSEARILAGLVTVKGKGVIITISNKGFITVDDEDILNILNELRASDAQAMAVNDERIVATTEVRKAGNYIMVNGRQLLPPYVIKAIAVPENLEHSLKMVGGIVEKLRSYGLKIEVKKEDNVIIPSVRDDGTVLKTDLLTPIND